MRAIIFINGQFHEPKSTRRLIRPDDYIIAVNGGTYHALSINVMPHTIIGDLDSLGPAEEARVRSGKSDILRFPSRKDETDLELGLRYAIEKGYNEILLLAALGGRLDQSFANVCLLTLPELRGIDVRIVEGTQTAFLICDSAEIVGKPGNIVSILPIGGDASGITNRGLEWPLDNATLALGTTQGISNVMLGERAYISVREGMLFCVVDRKSHENRSDSCQQTPSQKLQ